MSFPQPEVALTDDCAVIHHNTLYTYSEKAFQAIKLSEGQAWSTLARADAVTDGVCVGSTPADDTKAAFFVVGGKGNATYQGIQKYTYATGQWETLTLSSQQIVNRVGHGAVYINSSDSILVYAGATDGSTNPSTTTFSVGASGGSLLAFESPAPPTWKPILLPWSKDSAVLLGGSTWNTKVMLFSSGGWKNAGATLAAPFQKNTSSVRAALVTGDDGSKMLYMFDMSVSPNTVARTVLVDGSGNVVTNSALISKRWDESAVDKRAGLTEANWPAYNSSMAPTTTRINYALASDPDGMVVIVGGGSPGMDIFNAKSNSWSNATALFVGNEALAAGSASWSSSSLSTLISSSSPDFAWAPSSRASQAALSAAVSSASTMSSAAAAEAATAGSFGPSTSTILGAILGVFFGIAFVLCLIYLCVRRKRARVAQAQIGGARAATASPQPPMSLDEKKAYLYANAPAAAPRRNVFCGHQTSNSAGSFSSMANLMGRGHPKAPPGGPKRNSADSMFCKAFKSTISKPIPHQPAPIEEQDWIPPPDRDEKSVAFAANTTGPRLRDPAVAAAINQQGQGRRSSGWNRYWSGGSTLNILGFGSGNNIIKRNTVASDRSSYYSDLRDENGITKQRAAVPALNIYEPRASFSKVNSASPTMAHTEKSHGPRISEANSAQVVGCLPSQASGEYLSGISASLHDAWDPSGSAQAEFPMPPRAPSSAYTASVYTTVLASSDSRPPTLPSVPLPNEGERRGVPSGISTQPPLARADTSDMSWLNLGAKR